MYRSLYNRNWRLFLANGDELAFTTCELYSFLTSRRFLLALALVFVILVATDPPLFQESLPILERAAFWLVTIIFYVVLLLAGLAGVKLYNLRRDDKAIVLPFISVPVLCITALLAVGFGVSAFGAHAPEASVTRAPIILATSLVASQCFEFVIAKWIFVEHLRESRSTSDDTHIEPLLVTSGGSIPLSSILYLEAREHYVDIVQVDRLVTVRSTLSALTNQLPADAGFRVHRSFWVAKSTLQSAQNSEAFKDVRVSGGRSIPVARSRQKDFRDWYQENFR